MRNVKRRERVEKNDTCSLIHVHSRAHHISLETQGNRVHDLRANFPSTICAHVSIYDLRAQHDLFDRSSTCSSAYQLAPPIICLLARLSTYSPAHPPAHPLTHLLIRSSTYSSDHLLAVPLIHLFTRSSTCSPVHPLARPLIHLLARSYTCSPAMSPSYSVSHVRVFK